MKVTKIVSLVVVSIIMMSTTGCLSVWSHSSSKKEILMRRAVLSGNQRAIKAVKLGEDGVGIGIDIGNLEALTEHPIRQLGAAVGDAALIWGAYQGVKSITDNSSENNDTTVGRDNISVNGDGNTINVGNSKTETSGASGASVGK